MVDVGTFYSRPTLFTDLADRASLADQLPHDVGTLVQVIQGLVIYDVVASDFYSVDVPEERANEIHIRHAVDLVDHVLAIDNSPLTVRRPPHRRLFGRCRHYAVLLAALLRHKHVPARARCGFATYFNPGRYEDHWVCEYWQPEQHRWVLVDAQLDEVWQTKLNVDFDCLDVPRNRFLVAGEAWSRCRSGDTDPATFGVGHVGLRGLWFVAGDVIRDVVALNRQEMLPWDVWGDQPKPGEALDQQRLEFFDGLAALSRESDARLAEIFEICRNDDRVRLPDAVLNSLTGELQSTD